MGKVCVTDLITRSGDYYRLLFIPNGVKKLILLFLVRKDSKLPVQALVSQDCEIKPHPGGSSGKESWVLIPGSVRPTEVGNGNPLQYSCLENSLDRGSWQDTVHRGCKKSNMTKWLSIQIHTHTHIHTHTYTHTHARTHTSSSASWAERK